MALFSCNISTTKWLKRIIFTLFLLLFCSAIKIIPIHIQTTIITDRVSTYIDLREEPKVIKSSDEQNNLEKGLKGDFNVHSREKENRYLESVKKDNNTNRIISTKLDFMKDDLDTSNDTIREGPSVVKEIQGEVNNNNTTAFNISEENQKKQQKGFHQTPITCRRMRLKLGGPQQKSILASFGKGRLGNKLSSFASCYAMAKDYGLYNYISENQYSLLRRVFDFPRLKEEREDSMYYVWKKGK